MQGDFNQAGLVQANLVPVDALQGGQQQLDRQQRSLQDNLQQQGGVPLQDNLQQQGGVPQQQQFNNQQMLQQQPDIQMQQLPNVNLQKQQSSPGEHPCHAKSVPDIH